MRYHRRVLGLWMLASAFGTSAIAQEFEIAIPQARGSHEPAGAVSIPTAVPSHNQSHVPVENAVFQQYEPIGTAIPASAMPGPGITPVHFQPGPAYAPASNDPWGPQRMETPTPVANSEFAGSGCIDRAQSPDSATMGIRLDTTYTFVRETMAGVYTGEHQAVYAAGATILPLQTPCVIFGIRGLGTYADNMSITKDTEGATADFFFGTRYKRTYLKAGGFWDWQQHWGKAGATASVMTYFPLLHVVTADFNYAYGNGTMVYGPNTATGYRQVLNADYTGELRLGKFFCRELQAGFTGRYLDYNGKIRGELSFGAFANVYLWRMILGTDLTGGDEGLRGYATVSFGWGCAPSRHPQDARLAPVDTVSWITRPTDRDISVQLREWWTSNR